MKDNISNKLPPSKILNLEKRLFKAVLDVIIPATIDFPSASSDEAVEELLSNEQNLQIIKKFVNILQLEPMVIVSGGFFDLDSDSKEKCISSLALIYQNFECVLKIIYTYYYCHPEVVKVISNLMNETKNRRDGTSMSISEKLDRVAKMPPLWKKVIKSQELT